MRLSGLIIFVVNHQNGPDVRFMKEPVNRVIETLVGCYHAGLAKDGGEDFGVNISLDLPTCSQARSFSWLISAVSQSC